MPRRTVSPVQDRNGLEPVFFSMGRDFHEVPKVR